MDVIPRLGTVVRGGSPERLRELFDVREAIEGKAAALLAQRASAVDMAVLRRLATRRDRPRPREGIPEFLRADQEFHQYIIAHCGNDELIRSAQILDLLGRCLRWTSVDGRTGPDGIVVSPKHEDVAEAIATGDPEVAERVARKHLRNAADAIAMATALRTVSEPNRRPAIGGQEVIGR